MPPFKWVPRAPPAPRAPLLHATEQVTGSALCVPDSQSTKYRFTLKTFLGKVEPPKQIFVSLSFFFFSLCCCSLYEWRGEKKPNVFRLSPTHCVLVCFRCRVCLCHALLSRHLLAFVALVALSHSHRRLSLTHNTHTHTYTHTFRHAYTLGV